MSQQAFAESQATESQATESQQALTESQAGLASSTTAAYVDSAFAFLLPPHDAKDTATYATNKNTNFFISFLLLKFCNTYVVILIDTAKIYSFLIRCSFLGKNFAKKYVLQPILSFLTDLDFHFFYIWAFLLLQALIYISK